MKVLVIGASRSAGRGRGRHVRAAPVAGAIGAALGAGGAELHEPRFNGSDWAYLKACLDSTFVTGQNLVVDGGWSIW